MSAQQTSYSFEQSAPTQPGMIANSDVQGARIVSRRNDNASPIAFGLLVCRSSDTDDLGFDGALVSRQALGVLAWQQSKENGTDGCPTKEMGAIVENGEVYVTVVEDVTPDSTVKVYIVDYTGTTAGAVVGAFGDSAVSAKTATLSGAKYVTRASAGGVAKLRLNLPGPVLLTAD